MGLLPRDSSGWTKKIKPQRLLLGPVEVLETPGEEAAGNYSLSGFCEDYATAGRRLGASPGTLDQEVFQEELALTTMQRTTAA